MISSLFSPASTNATASFRMKPRAGPVCFESITTMSASMSSIIPAAVEAELTVPLIPLEMCMEIMVLAPSSKRRL